MAYSFAFDTKPMNSASRSTTGNVSDWAQAAMADAVALELISGAETDDGIFLQPQGDAAREQVATILQSFCTRTLGWS